MVRNHLVLGAVGVLFLIGSALAVTGGRGISQQGSFLQSGTGATLRTIEAELRDTVKCAQFSGADIGAQITAAIAALPATGGLVDCRTITGTQTLASSLTLNKANTVILLGNVKIVLGSNQIIVPVLTHMLAIYGTAPYGSPSSAIQSGTQITYTGTGVAFKFGDATANTDNFVMQDVGIDVSAGGANGAIALQLNRAKLYALIRPRFSGQVAVGNTQKMLDLEGTGDSTTGYMESPRFDNGNTAVYFGPNANANFFIGGNYAGPVLATSTCFDFAGGAGTPADGNTVFGGDVENWGTSFHYDYATDNQMFGVRTEVATNLAITTANSSRNMGFSNGVTLPIVDLGNYNAFATTLSPILSQTKIQIHNKQDVASNLWIGAGLTADQDRFLSFLDKSETSQWRFWVDSSNTFSLQRQTGLLREQLGSANSFYNAEGGGGIIFNGGTNSGTSGSIFQSGGATPATVFRASSTGISTDDLGYKAKRGTTGCTTAAAVGATCTTTVSWTTAFADANYTAKCTGRLITSGVPVEGGITATLAASVTFQTVAATAAAAKFTNIDCQAEHD